MNKLSAYRLSIGAVILRFYLMMAIVLIAGFSGMWWIGFLALPLLISIMAGVKMNSNKTKGKKDNKRFTLPKSTTGNFPEVA